MHPSIRRVTGSTDIPLTDKGIAHAQRVAQRIPKGASIGTSPMTRAMETAKIVGKAPRLEAALSPWALGEHEGKPSEEERPKIQHMITAEPDKDPGVSEFSGKKGESFNSFRRRMLWGTRHDLSTLKPGEIKVKVTHGRNIRVVDAWLKKGAPEDLSVDSKAMLSKSMHVGTGDLERVDMKNKRLEHVERADKPGLYYMRHGDTEWNQSQPGQQETGS